LCKTLHSYLWNNVYVL